MASALGAIKFAKNIIRSRLPLMNELSEVYIPAITRKKETLMELINEKAERAMKSELARKMKVLKGYYTLEMAPPSSSGEIKRLTEDLQLTTDFFKSKAFMHLTVKQAWLLFLIGLEIFLWFFIGETIGKWHLVGYSV